MNRKKSKGDVLCLEVIEAIHDSYYAVYGVKPKDYEVSGIYYRLPERIKDRGNADGWQNTDVVIAIIHWLDAHKVLM